MQTSSSSVISIFIPLLDVTREIATYSWRWENMNCARYTPTCLSDYPWLLLMVIAKHTDMGNCLHWNLKGIMVSDSVRHSLGMYTFLQCCTPFYLLSLWLQVYIYLPIFVIINLVPLHRPEAWSKFLSNITWTPTYLHLAC